MDKAPHTLNNLLNYSAVESFEVFGDVKESLRLV